jgi:hypothetical protein
VGSCYVPGDDVMTVAEMPEGTSHNSVPVYEFRAPSVFVAVC